MGNVYEEKAMKYTAAMQNPAAAYAKKGFANPTSDEILTKILKRGIEAAVRIDVLLKKGVRSYEDLKQIQLDMNALDAADAVVEGEAIPYTAKWSNVSADPETAKEPQNLFVRAKEFFFPSDDIWEDDEKLVAK